MHARFIHDKNNKKYINWLRLARVRAKQRLPCSYGPHSVLMTVSQSHCIL